MQFKVDVYFYGDLATYLNMNQIEVELPHSMNVAELKTILASEFCTWQAYNQPIYNAINQDLVEEEAVIKVGDVISFLPIKPMV